MVTLNKYYISYKLKIEFIILHFVDLLYRCDI